MIRRRTSWLLAGLLGLVGMLPPAHAESWFARAATARVTLVQRPAWFSRIVSIKRVAATPSVWQRSVKQIRQRSQAQQQLRWIVQDLAGQREAAIVQEQINDVNNWTPPDRTTSARVHVAVSAAPLTLPLPVRTAGNAAPVAQSAGSTGIVTAPVQEDRGPTPVTRQREVQPSSLTAQAPTSSAGRAMARTSEALPVTRSSAGAAPAAEAAPIAAAPASPVAAVIPVAAPVVPSIPSSVPLNTGTTTSTRAAVPATTTRSPTTVSTIAIPAARTTTVPTSTAAVESADNGRNEPRAPLSDGAAATTTTTTRPASDDPSPPPELVQDSATGETLLTLSYQCDLMTTLPTEQPVTVWGCNAGRVGALVWRGADDRVGLCRLPSIPHVLEIPDAAALPVGIAVDSLVIVGDSVTVIESATRQLIALLETAARQRDILAYPQDTCADLLRARSWSMDESVAEPLMRAAGITSERRANSISRGVQVVRDGVVLDIAATPPQWVERATRRSITLSCPEHHPRSVLLEPIQQDGAFTYLQVCAGDAGTVIQRFDEQRFTSGR